MVAIFIIVLWFWIFNRTILEVMYHKNRVQIAEFYLFKMLWRFREHNDQVRYFFQDLNLSLKIRIIAIAM